MEDLAGKAFRISQEYIDQPKKCDHPILLGFTKEERVWTNQERSPEELVDFIMQDRTRQILFYSGFYFNKLGIEAFECGGTVVKAENGYYFQADPEAFQGYSENDAKFELPDRENAALYEPVMEAIKNDPDSLKAMVVSRDNDGENGYYVILRVYPGISREEASQRFYRVIFLELVKAADIHNYKQLGKFMNQAQKLFVEYLGQKPAG